MLAELRAYVIADSAVSALIITRMFPVVLPQSIAYPAISYNQVSGVRERSLCGPAGYTHPRITINSWATSYSQVRALAEAVRKRIDGFRGMIGGVRVGSIVLDNEFDQFEQEAGQAGIYRVMQDYIVSFTED